MSYQDDQSFFICQTVFSIFLTLQFCNSYQERRRALDAERSARLAEMQMKRKRREEEIENEKIERDKV